jgi:hypothetical protein
MIHDYWDRPYYHAVMKYITVIDGVDSLMIGKIKAGNLSNEIMEDYNEYKYDYK